MAGHFDFRHDGHEARRRIRHDFPHVVLRIEAAVLDAVVFSLGRLRSTVADVMADQRLGAPRADVRQLRILLDLEPPALVIREVPMEPVHLVNGE